MATWNPLRRRARLWLFRFGNKTGTPMKPGLRRDALAIFKAALAAADPAAMVEDALRRRRDLDRYERIYVVGGGKAGGTMARAAERVLGRRITAGCVAVKDGDAAKSRRIELRASGHPVPDER